MRLHDLSRVVRPGMPVYPGDPGVVFHPHAAIAADGYRVTRVELGTHAGTHLDAPAHFLAGGDTVEQLALSRLVGPARVVDLREGIPEIGPGDRLLVQSGWSDHWGEPGYFDRFPGIPAALAARLAEGEASLVGVETPSLHPDPVEDSRMHRLLLGAGVLIVENLVGLRSLPGRVFLAVLPLPLAGLDGSPCRAAAFESFEESGPYGQFVEAWESETQR